MTNAKVIVVLGSVRDYHAVDWYINLRKVYPHVIFISDCDASEGLKNSMPSGFAYENLLRLDWFLLASQTYYANIWRNILKILFLPLNSIYLRLKLRSLKNVIIHAHPTYYGALAALSGFPFIVTPQGSELLVRARNSRVYAYLASLIFDRASLVTVDSITMQQCAQRNVKSTPVLVVQNGVDVSSIIKASLQLNQAPKSSDSQSYLLSFRSLFSNYNIIEILEQRNTFLPHTPIYLCYPAYDQDYKEQIKKLMLPIDKDLGRLPKNILYRYMSNCLCAISIPTSDSSPRSVYEHIFNSRPIILRSNSYLHSLPSCMRSRIVEISSPVDTWLPNSLTQVNCLPAQYSPSPEAFEMLDSVTILRKHFVSIYG